jgi:hypothetical protein
LDIEAIAAGTDSGVFEHELPLIIDNESDIPIVEINDPS